jgi:glycosyltransferase involved in cell wall biosynthesis
MKILFISNSASRTGAPIGLLHLLRLLKAHTSVSFEVLLREGGGALTEAFETLCKVTVYGDLWSTNTLPQRFARRMGLGSVLGMSCLSPVEALYKDQGIDLIYANTITNGGIIAELSRLGLPILCHVHELESVIEKYGAENLEHHKKHCTHYIADSRATQRNLVKRHRIPLTQLDLALEFIDVDEVLAHVDSPMEVDVEMAGRFVVGGCGYSYHRKGKDLFAKLAQSVVTRDPQRRYCFVWVGGEPAGEEADRFREDIRRMGLSEQLIFVPQVKNTYPYFREFDVFALTSREEPLGMVMLEAACFECPVLCFEAAGGAPEFVGEDAGVVVPNLNVEEMADHVIALAADEVLRTKLGVRARAKVEERHDIAVVPPMILAVIEKVIKAECAVEQS